MSHRVAVDDSSSDEDDRARFASVAVSGHSVVASAGADPYKSLHSAAAASSVGSESKAPESSGTSKRVRGMTAQQLEALLSRPSNRPDKQDTEAGENWMSVGLMKKLGKRLSDLLDKTLKFDDSRRQPCDTVELPDGDNVVPLTCFSKKPIDPSLPSFKVKKVKKPKKVTPVDSDEEEDSRLSQVATVMEAMTWSAKAMDKQKKNKEEDET